MDSLEQHVVQMSSTLLGHTPLIQFLSGNSPAMDLLYSMSLVCKLLARR
jgi:hypothetical protein